MDQKRKILIIEDSKEYRKLLKDVFVMLNYEVKEANQGIDGLYLAQMEGDFDAIIADLKMPNMDGLEFLKQLKEKEANKKNTPVIIVSNVAQDYIKEEALRRGATAFISKDELNPTQIVKKITDIIQEDKKKPG